MSRKGKIARLPRKTRDELNLRLDDGQDGPQLLDWLNNVPEVSEILKEQFGGVPISKQNLSEWRQGGFREWQIREDLIEEACKVSDDADDMNEVVDTSFLAGDLTAILSARYAALLNSWDGEPDPKFEDKLRLLRGLLRDLALMQKTTCQIDKQIIEHNQRQADEDKRDMDELKKKALAPFDALLHQRALATLYGGGEDGKKIAAYIAAVKHDLPLPKLEVEEPPGQTKSNQVKPQPAFGPEHELSVAN